MSEQVLPAWELVLDDLRKSGLEPANMKIRLFEDVERNACRVSPGINGYVIPYYGLMGKPLPFYRVRLFDSPVKYKQVRDTPNHVYFPPGFMKCLNESKAEGIVIVEGEKKAALLLKHGIPAIAFGGVDSWRNRSILLPIDTQFTKFNYTKEVIKAQLPTGEESEDLNLTGTATGFDDLTEYALKKKLSLIIVYDSDTVFGVKKEVQRAAAALGYELRHRGFTMSQIKQIILPPICEDKTGVDDFILHEDGGIDAFKELYAKAMASPRAFPRHPNAREHIARKLQRSKISRKDMQSLAMSLMAELDAGGYRMHCSDEGQMYYFDNSGAKLMRVNTNTSNSGSQSTSGNEFERLLYQDYGVSTAADSRFMQWVNTIFAGEDPITEVHPHRVIARPKPFDDCIRFQISDGEYVRISSKGITLMKNGDDGILFEAGRTEPFDVQKLKEELKRQRQEPLTMWWNDVFSQSRLKYRGQNQLLLSLLYYASPWLYRWRNTQLPVELVLGEAGSGKSTLQELRLAIQTGKADLKNAPGDLKDWHAALSNSGGLHVTDNVQLLNKTLRATLSDEICRLITEPEPHIEMRKLYTNAELAKVKVDNVFVFTAIIQPFLAADLLQRAVIIEFDKSQDKNLTYSSTWKTTKLDERGGREAWLAHHFIVLERFFQAVEESWDPHYRAEHRLVNFEQILLVLARDVFKLEEGHNWIPAKLSDDVTKTVAANDWALEGLVEFARTMVSSSSVREFSAREIADWAGSHGEFDECQLLINARKLGMYLANNKHMIHKISGIEETTKKANRMHYRVDKKILENRE